jgi:hypothetical protein
LIANNGFMIKNSPSENRTMYIAACQALAGLIGGVTSILAGLVLKGMAGWEWEFLGKTWGHYHVLFAVSVVLRWISAFWVHWLREPNAKSTRHLVGEVMSSPIGRFLASPAGAFLTFRGEGDSQFELPAVNTMEEAVPESGGSGAVPPPKHIGRRGARQKGRRARKRSMTR